MAESGFHLDEPYFTIDCERSMVNDQGLFIALEDATEITAAHLSKSQTKELIRYLVTEFPDYESDEEFTFYQNTVNGLYYRVSDQDDDPDNPLMVPLDNQGTPLPIPWRRAVYYVTPQSAFKPPFVEVSELEVTDR